MPCRVEEHVGFAAARRGHDGASAAKYVAHTKTERPAIGVKTFDGYIIAASNAASASHSPQ